MPRRTILSLLLATTVASLPLQASSLSGLLDRLETSAHTGARHAHAALEEGLRGETLPVDCLSPVLLTALQSGRAAAVAPWLRPPDLPAPRTWAGPAGLRIHYTIATDSIHAVPIGDEENPDDAVPRYVEEIGRALTEAIDGLDALGFHLSDRSPWIDVYLADPGDGVSGYVLPNPAAVGLQEARGGIVVLGNRLTLPRTVAAHQLGHLALLGYSYREPAWWHEATAAWISVQAAGTAAGEKQALLARLDHPEDGLATDDLLRMRGGLLFPAFLSLGEVEPTTVRRIWEVCAALSGPNVLEAIDRIAGETGGGSLADVLRAFYASWAADTAGRDRLLAELGVQLPLPRPGAEFAGYPANGETGPVRPLGAVYLHLQSDDQPGGLALAVRGNSQVPFEPLLLVRRSPTSRFVPVPIPVDEHAEGRIRYPWGEISDALVVLVALPGEGEFSFSYALRHRPEIPFDLMQLAAVPTPDGVFLSWSTDSEADVYGWNVYRGATPDRTFKRITSVPIPAGGGDGSPASYTFLDGSPPGPKVYYRVEAVTIDGFVQSTHGVGTRPGRRPR